MTLPRPPQTLRCILCGIVASVALGCGGTWDTGPLYAQSGFAKAELNRLTNRSRTSFYSAQGQQNRLLNRAIPQAGVQGINRRNFAGGLSSSTAISARKPFAGVASGPTVSPYLALSRPFGSATDYQTLVRPLREQQRNQERQQIYEIQRQRRLNQLAARAPFNTQGDENAAPTGHAAGFQRLGAYLNTGGYFPPPSEPKQRR